MSYFGAVMGGSLEVSLGEAKNWRQQYQASLLNAALR